MMKRPKVSSGVDSSILTSASSKTGHNQQESVNILNTMSISDTKALPARSAPSRSSKRKHQEAQDASSPTATKQQSTSHKEPTRKAGQLVRPTKHLEGKRNRLNKSLSTSTTVFEIEATSSDGERESTHGAKKNQDDQDETDEYQDDQDEAEEDQDEHDENQEQEIELYGQESAWRIVWIAARTLCRFDGDNTQSKKLPKLSTDAVRHVINIAKELKMEFRSLNAKPDAVKSIKKQVSNNIAAIDEEINNIDEMIGDEGFPAGAKMELVVGLYAHAIPNLVSMLRCALCCTSMDYSRSEDWRYIKNIIIIQDSILQACKIALSLKAKVKQGVGIVGSTSKKILPYLTIVREAFGDELDSREKQLNKVALEASHKKRLEKAQQENEENAKKQKENCFNLSQNIDRSIAWFSSNYDFQSSNSSIDTPTTDTQWTDDQDLALIVQLQNPNTCLLPAEERYLAILNAPLLQNKLPEHIRDRAIYYKDSMIHCWGAVDYAKNLV